MRETGMALASLQRGLIRGMGRIAGECLMKSALNMFRGTVAAVSLGSLVATHAFAADDTIKVGILHSLSGTMAISETTLKDAMLMLIDE